MSRGSGLRATRESVAARAPVQLALHFVVILGDCLVAGVVGGFGRADPVHVFTTLVRTEYGMGWVLDGSCTLPGRANRHAYYSPVGSLRDGLCARCISVRVRVRVRVHRRRGHRRRRGAHVRGG